MISETEMEKFLQNKIFPDLERGRLYFDLPHTRAVVHHIKKIIKPLNFEPINRMIFIIAAYSHDWGYSDLFDKSNRTRYSEILKKKALFGENV